jgi:Tol biopolymer transport system component
MGITQRILAIGSTMAVIAAVVAVTMASQAAADNHAGGCDGITWAGDDTVTDQIYLADADGTSRAEISSVVVAGAPTLNLQPQWSPDDVRITWSGDDGSTDQIYVAQTDGTPRNLISTVSGGTDPTANVDPQWSPDGTQIAWSGLNSTNRIYVADRAGANRIEISSADTDPTLNFAPQSSPDGTQIAWSGFDGATTTNQIDGADADGTSRIRISTVSANPDPTDNVDPQWSPDGTQIAWSGFDGVTTTNQIYVAAASGTGRTEISTVVASPPTLNFAPQWSPNPADLSVLVVVDDPTPEVGDEIEATVTVSNDGPCDAVGVMVTGLSCRARQLSSATPSPSWAASPLSTHWPTAPCPCSPPPEPSPTQGTARPIWQSAATPPMSTRATTPTH